MVIQFENHSYSTASLLNLALSLSGPAESVRMLRFRPDQFFLEVKAKFHFCKRQVKNKVLV